MKGTRAGLTLFAAGILGMAIATPAGALTDEEVFRTFRFNFANPGGRALAMGGAFIGIADDATAAAANPAGLTNLIAQEFFSELRLDDTVATSISTLVGDPRGGLDPLVAGGTGDPDNTLHPSFISYVHPFEHWVLGVSRQELLNTSIEASNSLIDENVLPSEEIARALARMDALLETYNVSAGFRAGDKFAAGVTVSLSRLDIESRTDNLFDFGDGLVNDYATAIDDTDDALSFSVGVLYRPHARFSVGAVYRDGPEFDLVQAIEDTALSGNFPSAGVLRDFLGNRNVALDAFGNFSPKMFDDAPGFLNHFAVPDRYGIGFGIRPTDSFTIALDVVRVEYSDLATDFVANVNALTFPGDGLNCDLANPLPDGTFPCEYTTPVARYRFDDETIVRLGLEWVFSLTENVPFAVRVGAYNDPNVRLRADFGSGGVFVASNGTFPESDDVTHYTLGFGFVVQDKFQADFAADLSEVAKTYIASFIFHF